MPETDYLSLNEAAAASPGRPHTSSVWRWCRKGVRARNGTTVKLPCVRAGGRVFILRDALQTFFAAVADADAEHFDRPTKPSPSVPHNGTRNAARREREIQAAETEARKRGIL
ncbi:MAG: DUF1580 domain-containing protein [Phycisphaerales bacterium]|nr:DUF1580 domain-containing protein [Phycisphaerales bacterium]